MANEERTRSLVAELSDALSDARNWIATQPVPEVLYGQRLSLVRQIDAALARLQNKASYPDLSDDD